MDWLVGWVTIWRAVLMLGFVLAVCFGRPSPRVISVMVCNFTASVVFADDLITVGIADLLAAIVLLGGCKRAQIVATLFSVMCLIYVSGQWLGLSLWSIYAIIDLLAYAQLAVIGGLDRGIRRLARAFARRGAVPDSGLAQRGHATGGVALVPSQSKVIQ